MLRLRVNGKLIFESVNYPKGEKMPERQVVGDIVVQEIEVVERKSLVVWSFQCPACEAEHWNVQGMIMSIGGKKNQTTGAYTATMDIVFPCVDCGAFVEVETSQSEDQEFQVEASRVVTRHEICS